MAFASVPCGQGFSCEDAVPAGQKYPRGHFLLSVGASTVESQKYPAGHSLHLSSPFVSAYVPCVAQSRDLEV